MCLIQADTVTLHLQNVVQALLIACKWKYEKHLEPSDSWHVSWLPGAEYAAHLWINLTSLAWE